MRFLLILVLFVLLPYKNESSAGNIGRYVDDNDIVHFVEYSTPKREFKPFIRDNTQRAKNWFAVRRDSGECIPYEAPAYVLSSSKARVIDEVLKNGKPVVVTVNVDATDVTYYKTVELCQVAAKRLKRSLDKYR